MNKIFKQTAKYPFEYKKRREVTVRHLLTVEEMIEFVATVTTLCINREDGEYYSAVLPAVMDMAMITYYTDLEPGGELDEAYALAIGTPIMSIIDEYANKVQREQLIAAVQQTLSFEKEYICHTAAKDINEMAVKISEGLAGMNEVFDGIEGDAFKEAINNLSVMKDLDEEKLVRAVYDTQKK